MLGRLRARLAPDLTLRLEVPLPIASDQRAWDGVVVGLGEPAGGRADKDGEATLPVEAETRLIDVQAQVRRVRLKLRDAGCTSDLLVVTDTHRNRAALAAAGSLLAADFPVPGRHALRELGAGRHPGGSAIIVL